MNNSIQYPNLSDSLLLRGLGGATASQFLNACTLRSFSETTTLLEQGQPSPGLFLIASGNVNVFCQGPDGSTVLLSRCRPGATLGEIEAITDQPCAATCEIQSAGSVLFMPKPALMEMLSQQAFVRNLFQISLDRMQKDNQFRALNVNQSIPVKLANYLLMLANSSGEVRESQAFLASIVCCSRQTINKELGLLRADGVVRQTRGRIFILDRDSLRKIADGKEPCVPA